MIISLLNKIKAKHLSIAASVLIIMWMSFPLVVMLLNAINFDATTMYRIWITLMYVVGGLGTLLGFAYLYQLITNKEIDKRTKTRNLIPYGLFLLFAIWCLVCLKNTSHDFIAILGYGILQDNFLCYVAYGGFILLGSIAVIQKENAKLLANVFTIIATILSVVTLPNNSFSELFCKNEFVDCPAYYSVFFNTNHFAYYLAIAIILVGALFVVSNKKLEKILYLLSYSILILTLILNNTMGSYLAVLITLVMYLIWCLLTKERKKEAAVLLTLFLVVSLASNVIVDNVFVNFSNMFANIKTLFVESSTQEEVDAVGSGRGILWGFALSIIKKHPLFGIGLNNVYLAVHNVYLQIAMYTGLVGLALYLSPFVAKTVMVIKDRKETNELQKLAVFVAMSYIISAFFGLTVFYTAPYSYFIVGAAFGITNKEKLE